MSRVVPFTVVAILVAATAHAHVTVRPRESKAGATETYTIRVPTEGKTATASVELQIPPGVTVDSIEPADGVRSDVKRQAGRIISITWTVTIDPGQRREFTFAAKNPNEGSEIVWKVHQHYADGTTSEWVGAAGTRQPAPSTKLVSGSAGR